LKFEGLASSLNSTGSDFDELAVRLRAGLHCHCCHLRMQSTLTGTRNAYLPCLQVSYPTMPEDDDSINFVMAPTAMNKKGESEHVGTQRASIASIRALDMDAADADDNFSFRASVAQWYRRCKASQRERVETYSVLDWLCFFVPCLRWLRTYSV
jgi:hypothetical protein